MSYFPMFTELAGREIVICGGGAHAVEKAERLKPFGAALKVISREISPEMERLEASGGVVIERRAFREQDTVPRPVFVVAAEERAENERIVGICRVRHIPVNAVDMQDLCDFIFPALITSGELCVGIGTGGRSPAAAVELKRRIGEVIPENAGEILTWISEIRETVRREIPDRTTQHVVLRRIAAEAFALSRPLTEAELAEIRRDAETRPDPAAG